MNSPIKWVGGKRKEIKLFEKYIPKFDTYVEPFVGGGALYWYLEPKNAVINDINEHLVNFYEVLRDNYNELYSQLQDMILSKEYFDNIVKRLNNKEYKDKIEQASIFYYLNKTAFSGKWRENKQGKFNSSYGYYDKENYKKLDNTYSKLLNRTEIYNTDYKTILDKYKNIKNAFVFLDPPYLDCDSFYTANQQFDNIYKYIFDFMKDCKCKIMLVVKETEYINDLFKDYIVDSYNINYRHNAVSKKIHKHLVITNYKNTY
jgi:DNA adenine methylase